MRSKRCHCLPNELGKRLGALEIGSLDGVVIIRLADHLAVQKRTEEGVAMSETAAYTPEKFVSCGEPSAKLML